MWSWQVNIHTLSLVGGKSHFIVFTNIIFPCECHKGFHLPLLNPRSKSTTLCCILSPQALGKICRLWLPCTECVIFGTDEQWLFWEAQAVHFFFLISYEISGCFGRREAAFGCCCRWWWCREVTCLRWAGGWSPAPSWMGDCRDFVDMNWTPALPLWGNLGQDWGTWGAWLGLASFFFP